MNKLLRTLLLALVLFPMAASAGRIAELVDPPPVLVPQNVPPAKLPMIIRSVLIARGWQVTADTGAQVTATFEKDRGFRGATISVGYSPQQILVRYVDSKELEFGTEDGHRVIHSNYNKWIRYIVRDLEAQLAAAGV